MPRRILSLNQFINESKVIDKEFFIRTLEETFGYSRIESEEIVDSEVEYLNNLPDEIELYRIIFADSKKEINTDELGSHYSDNKESLIQNSSFATGYGDIKFLVTILARKEQIDIHETLHNRILYPNENEITIKNNGKGVKVQSIEKL